MTTVVLPATTQYAQDVLSGEIVAGRLVRLACERHLRWLEDGNGKGYWFDEEKAERVIQFFTFLKHRKGEQFAGKSFDLAPWQKFVVGSLFGWKRPDDKRVFRNGWVEVARKNGKSTLAAGLANYLAFFDEEPGAEVYTAAVKRDQAKIVWDEAKWQMENCSPALRNGIEIRVSNMHAPATSSKSEPLGSDRDSTDGLNPYGEIRDELHAWKDRDFLEKLDGAMGSRVQPLVIDITTAGAVDSLIYIEKHEYAVQVVENAVPDDTVFVYIATLDDGDDPFDEAVWVKSNPNIGVSKSYEYMRERALKAKSMISERNPYLRYQQNVITNQTDAYLSIDLWDAQKPQRQMAQLLRQRCYAGIDLSEKNDLTALELWFPDADGKGGDLLSWFWMPKDALERRMREDRVPYDAWAREGYIELTPGPVVDYAYLLAKMMEIRDEFDVRAVWMDPYKGRQFGIDLKGEDFEVEEVHQGFTGMNPCITEMTRVLEANGLRHGGHPVLRWMAGNVSVRMSPDMYVKFDKSDERRRIDGMVAAALAIGAGAAEQEEEMSSGFWA